MNRSSTDPRWRGLFLAGDWTATGWPATMEGAALRFADTKSRLEIGFSGVMSGPLVRSSYHADRQAMEAGVAA